MKTSPLEGEVFHVCYCKSGASVAGINEASETHCLVTRLVRSKRVGSLGRRAGEGLVERAKLEGRVLDSPSGFERAWGKPDGTCDEGAAERGEVGRA